MTRASFFKSLVGFVVGAPIVAKVLAEEPPKSTTAYRAFDMDGNLVSMVFVGNRVPQLEPITGSMWLDTDSNKLYHWDGEMWVRPGCNPILS